MIWMILAVIIAQTLAQAPVTTKTFTNGTGIIQKRPNYKARTKNAVKKEPCIYKEKKFEIDDKPSPFVTISAGQCQRLCNAVNGKSSETLPKCLAWTFEAGTTSCYIIQTRVTVSDNAIYGISNCYKPGKPAGMAPRCTLNPGTFGRINNRLLPELLPNYGDCKKNCDSKEHCIAWQYFSNSAYCRLSFWEVKEAKTNNYFQDVGFCFPTGHKYTQVGKAEPCWWCEAPWGKECGPNCCSGNNDCCKGPDVCASPDECPGLQCLHNGGQVCGDNCCPKGEFCCADSDGQNICVDSIDLCRAQNCQKDVGLPCGDQCCRGNSSCCTGLNTHTCVASIEDCIALECIEEGGQACGKSCCGGGTFCCNGKCLTDVDDCLAEQCLQDKGQICGKSCCRSNSKLPYCCQGTNTCKATQGECQMETCQNWCSPAEYCCNNPFWVCCPKNSGIVCAANPLFCRSDLAEFATGFIQNKV